MGKPTPIRISKTDIKEYRRLARNTKSKIKRTKDNYGIDLTTEISIPNIESFSTRKEFNKWKKEQERFTNRGTSEYQYVKNQFNVVASKKEIYELEKNTKKARRMAKKLQEKYKNSPFISGGKEQGTVEQRLLMSAKPNIGGIYVPPNVKFKDIQTRRYFETKQKNIKDRATEGLLERRSSLMKNNFIKILELSFNSDSDELIGLLKDIPPLDFVQMYHMYDEFDFDYFDSDNEEMIADRDMLSQMVIYAKDYHNGKTDTSLWDF